MELLTLLLSFWVAVAEQVRHISWWSSNTLLVGWQTNEADEVQWIELEFDIQGMLDVDCCFA